MRLRVLSFLILIVRFASSQPVEDKLIPIMQSELKREINEFGKLRLPPYYLSFQVLNVQSTHLAAAFGSLTNSYSQHTRVMNTDVKVGNYDLDDSHVDENQGGNHGGNYMRNGTTELPLADSAMAIQYTMWQQAKNVYDNAVDSYNAVKSKITEETKHIPDFSKEEASVSIDPKPVKFTDFFDQQSWKQKIKRLSKAFLACPEIMEGEASLQAIVERQYLISSEGTTLAKNRTYVYLSISASILATDGDVVPLHKSYFAYDAANLPSENIIAADIDIMIKKLKALRTAPMAEPYTGPAILYAPAAGVFFHEIFGHRVEGHRLKNKSDAQTFKEKIGQEVLLKSLSVHFDPTLTSFKGQPLNGSYAYDDEGIKARKVTVVENGILKTFLMSRSPIDNLIHSNGHGRGALYSNAVSRQSNLIVESNKEVSMSALRKMMITECKKQGKLYGYLFKDVVGGFTFTHRTIPNAFNIFPTEVYRVFTDGRPDELVRGVDLIGTPLAMFAEIAAADNAPSVFTGFCGAESGSIPVTAISPSIFVKRIETQKKSVTHVTTPVLPRPAGN